MVTTAQRFIGPPLTSGRVSLPTPSADTVGPTATMLKLLLSQFSDPRVREWALTPNPQAGVREMRWCQEHRDELSRTFGNLWIAVLGDKIVASGSSFAEVYDGLVKLRLRDTLVQHISPDPAKWDTLIA